MRIAAIVWSIASVVITAVLVGEDYSLASYVAGGISYMVYGLLLGRSEIN